MKNFKLLGVILLLLLSVLRSAESDSIHKTFATSPVQEVFTTDLPNDLHVHYIAKKKTKYRATFSESYILKNINTPKSFDFGVVEKPLIHSVVSTYHNQHHTHLHLYQLF